jgi:hypothetical protein
MEVIQRAENFRELEAFHADSIRPNESDTWCLAHNACGRDQHKGQPKS